jgi:hypothetical protein
MFMAASILFWQGFLAASPTAATPAYVQGNYANPQSPQKTVSVPYTAAQTPGNFNVVIVGWSDTAAHVTSVTDSENNAYRLAVGPTVGTGLSQAIYLAASIARGLCEYRDGDV